MWSGSSLLNDCVLINHAHCATNNRQSAVGMTHLVFDFWLGCDVGSLESPARFDSMLASRTGLTVVWGIVV
jgi:hypothetical protein